MAAATHADLAQVLRLRPDRNARADRRRRRLAVDRACSPGSASPRPFRSRHDGRRTSPTASRSCWSMTTRWCARAIGACWRTRVALRSSPKPRTRRRPIAAFKAHAPDIVIMDISMQGASGLEAIRNIRARDRSARILVFSMHSEVTVVKAAFSAGAGGYRHQEQRARGIDPRHPRGGARRARHERRRGPQRSRPRASIRCRPRWTGWANGRSRSSDSSRPG